MNLKPYSSIVLSLAGVILSGIGIYFIFIRPPLLPEDLNYMHTTLQIIKKNTPGLVNWLQKVFWVMGGYILSTGLLIIFISVSSFRMRSKGVFAIVLVSGVCSIGLMTVVNFILQSDFKLHLLTFTLLWAIALILYRFHR